MELTKSQQKIYDYIKQYIDNKGFSPSVREICEATGFKSTATIHFHMKNMEMKGAIERVPGTNRAIKLVGYNNHSSDIDIDVPVLGRVTAGIPITAVESIEGYVPVPSDLKRGRELFALRVMGESMINAGILDNDIVVVHKTPVAENGEIVVAMIDGEATVKRFYKGSKYVTLEPENDNFEPIVARECEILGRVISVVRYY